MSHPYSGAASYIYANEYRTPVGRASQFLGVDSDKPLLYNYHPYALNNARDRTVDERRKAKQTHPTPGKQNSQFTSPSSQASSLPSNVPTATKRSSTINQIYSSPRLNHPYAHPTLLPISPTSPEPTLPTLAPTPTPPSLRLPLKFKLTLPNPFRQNPQNSPWPPPRSPTPTRFAHHQHQHPHIPDSHSGSTWRWSTLSSTKFKLSSWFPGVRRRSSSSRSKAKKDSTLGPVMHRSHSSSRSNGSNLDLSRGHPSDSRSGPARSTSYRPPTGDSENTKRGKSLHFAVGAGRRAERDLDFAIIST